MMSERSTAATLRLLTPEQYHQGFIAPGGWRVPFGPILRVDENGNYVVREPKPVIRYA
jgi:hypothetical protein